MNKKEIIFRGIKVERISSIEEHEELLSELEGLFLHEGKADMTELPKMILEIQNNIINTQAKLNKNSGINFPALLFFLGGYISGLIGVSDDGMIGWLIGSVAAFVLLCGCIKRTNSIVDQYNDELLAYQTVEKLLIFIYNKYRKS